MFLILLVKKKNKKKEKKEKKEKRQRKFTVMCLWLWVGKVFLN